MDIIQEVGAYAGFAAVVGLAVLAALYFSQARDVRRLREWAGRAPERAAEQPIPGQTVLPEQAAQEAARPAATGAVRPIPAAKPAPAAAAGAKPATATGPAAPPMPAPPGAKPAPATPGAKPGPPGSGAKPGPATPGAKPGPATPGAKPGPATPGAKPGPATPAPGTKPAPAKPGQPAPVPATAAATPAAKATPVAPGKPAPPGKPATPPPVPPRPPVVPPRPGPVGRSPSAAGSQSTAVLPASARLRDAGRGGASRGDGLDARYIALIVAGVLVIGAGAAFGVSQLGGDDKPSTSDSEQGGAERQAPINPTTVTVSVLNGTTVPGLAAQIGDEVETAGFQRGNVANAIDQQRTTSVVLFAEGADREARLVARKLGIAQVEAVDPDSQALAGNASVVVIVGADQTS